MYKIQLKIVFDEINFNSVEKYSTCYTSTYIFAQNRLYSFFNKYWYTDTAKYKNLVYF